MCEQVKAHDGAAFEVAGQLFNQTMPATVRHFALGLYEHLITKRWTFLGAELENASYQNRACVAVAYYAVYIISEVLVGARGVCDMTGAESKAHMKQVSLQLISQWPSDEAAAAPFLKHKAVQVCACVWVYGYMYSYLDRVRLMA